MKQQKQSLTPRTIAVLNNIRTKRKDLGYSQEYVALEIGISVRWYQQLENGSSRMTIDNLNRIADVLQVDPRYFYRSNAGSQNELCDQCITALQDIFHNYGSQKPQ